MGPEAKIQKKIVSYLEGKGCKVVKTIALNTNGHADLIFCYKGYYGEIEVKVPGANARPLQLIKGQQTIDAGGQWKVGRSISDARDMLDYIDKIYGL